MTTTNHRPFGVAFLSLLIIVIGALQVGAGILLLVQRNDSDILTAADVASSDVTVLGVVAIILGVVAVLVGVALRRGASWARTLVGIIAVVNVVSLVWAAISYHQIHWYNVAWPAVLYALVAGYLFLDADSKRYFSR
jgi:hypothetical protein